MQSESRWATSEDIPTRFIAYGWNVLRVGDANDVEASNNGLSHMVTNVCVSTLGEIRLIKSASGPDKFLPNRVSVQVGGALWNLDCHRQPACLIFITNMDATLPCKRGHVSGGDLSLSKSEEEKEHKRTKDGR